MSYKLDIFELLKKLNNSDLNIWNTLDEEQRKAFAPYVVTRWMSGSKNPWQIMMVDEFVNNRVFDLGTHPELLMKLLACCATNDNKRFEWIGKKTAKKSNMVLELVKEYYDYTTHEAEQALLILSNDDIIELADELGYEKDQMTKLKKELK